MAKRLLPPDFRVLKDNGDPATDATLVFKLGGTNTNTPVWYDPELTEPTSVGTATISCDATGFPAASGNDVSVWGLDTVTYDVVISATGYNGGASKTISNLVVADAATTDSTAASLALNSAIDNGGFESWSNGTSFSNVSGDGDGDVTADGWYVSQSTLAGNAISRQTGMSSARYCLRVGRPDGSTNANAIRLWATVKPELAYRLRGQEVALRYTVRKGAGFSPSNIAVKLCTGTTESEDGDLIATSGFAGNTDVVSQNQTLTTSAQRFEHIVTLANSIKEIGFQVTLSGWAGTATNDYIEIGDVELKLATDSEDFEGRPEALDFILSNLSTGGRLLAKTAFTDPNADRVMIWDDSAGDFVGATLGTGISISGTEIGLDADLVTYAGITPSANVQSFLGAADYAAMRTQLSLVVGTNVQAYDAQLADIAGLTPADNAFIVGNGANFTAEPAATAFGSMGFSGSVTAPQFTTIELGHASDTTLARGAAGLPTVEGVSIRLAGKTAVPVPASAMVANTTNGAASGQSESTTNKVMLRTLDFDTSTQEGAQFLIPMPKGWNEGTVTFQPIWTAASGSGGVVWELRAVALSDDDAIDTAFGTGQTSTDTLITANDVHIGPESSAITIAGTPAEDDLVVFQIRRNVSDGSDTLGVDAKLIAIRLFVTTSAANDA